MRPGAGRPDTLTWPEGLGGSGRPHAACRTVPRLPLGRSLLILFQQETSYHLKEVKLCFSWEQRGLGVGRGKRGPRAWGAFRRPLSPGQGHIQAEFTWEVREGARPTFASWPFPSVTQWRLTWGAYCGSRAQMKSLRGEGPARGARARAGTGLPRSKVWAWGAEQGAMSPVASIDLDPISACPAAAH